MNNAIVLKSQQAKKTVADRKSLEKHENGTIDNDSAAFVVVVALSFKKFIASAIESYRFIFEY